MDSVDYTLFCAGSSDCRPCCLLVCITWSLLARLRVGGSYVYSWYSKIELASAFRWLCSSAAVRTNIKLSSSQVPLN